MALEMQIVRQQLQSCMAQRDQSAQTFQQCIGAIAVLEEQLKVILAEEMQKAEEMAKLNAEAANSEAGNAAVMDSGVPPLEPVEPA